MCFVSKRDWVEFSQPKRNQGLRQILPSFTEWKKPRYRTLFRQDIFLVGKFAN